MSDFFKYTPKNQTQKKTKKKRESRTTFEAQPDTGFIGKGLIRIFNQIWNYFFKGLIGTTMLVVGMPVLVAINLSVSFVLAVTSIIWVPVSAITKYVFNMLIYDTEHSR